MWRNAMTILAVVLALLMTGSTLSAQQQVQRDYSDDYDNYDYDSEYIDRDDSRDYDYDDDRNYNGDYIRIDRYLDADIWVNRSDNEYFIGDNIKMHYRLNRDAYVAVVSIDSRGRVNLLYPAQPGDNPWRRGGMTYNLPGANDDFDLVVDGPEGTEVIQIIASSERFPIPNWYNGSGIICRDDDDRDEFMDYLISRYFHRYPGQRFAIDREVIYVNDWEPTYFRPVYYPTYPSWSVTGNMYIDYPFGASIYVDGFYWGCAPLYIPRVLVGWRTITVYDPWGYCWEDYVHVSHYNTIVLDHRVVRPRPHVVSKYKEVHVVGYRDPVKHGYPNYTEVVKKHARIVGKTTTDPSYGITKSKQRPDLDASTVAVLPKKHVRGNGLVVKTDRGYESSSIGGTVEKRSRSERQNVKSRFDGDKTSGTIDAYRPEDSRSGSSDRGGYGRVERKSSSGNSGSSSTQVERKTEQGKSGGSSEYYRKKSGKVERKQNGSSGKAVERRERQQSQPQVQERTKSDKGKGSSDQNSGSDNNSGSRGGEVKQKSSGSGNSGGGSVKQSSPRSGSSGSRSGGKGRN